jgi:hypothetical protein
MARASCWGADLSMRFSHGFHEVPGHYPGWFHGDAPDWRLNVFSRITMRRQSIIVNGRLTPHPNYFEPGGN